MIAVLKRPILLLPGLAVVLVVAVVLWRQWQGPKLPAYQLEALPLVQNVVATGRVISTSRAQIGSEVTGTVLERRVQEGDTVKPGDVLVVLRADDLTAKLREAQAALTSLLRSARPQAEASLRQAEAQLAQASREKQRRAELVARQLIAREQAEQSAQAENIARAGAERARAAASALAPGQSEEQQLRERIAAAQAALAKTVVRATVAGTVLTRKVEPGDLVQPGRVLFDIALAGDTEILLPVDEKNLEVLRVGQSAQCVADAWPDRQFPAVVRFIAPSIDAQRGTVELRLKVDPVPDMLRQDMTVSVNIETGRRAQALAVPNDALLEARAGTATALLVRDGRLRRLPVKLGLRGLAFTEVTAGLAVGDTVLASAADVKLADGTRLRAATQPLPSHGTDPSTRRESPVKFD
jgi:HlyD family secretion protein